MASNQEHAALVALTRFWEAWQAYNPRDCSMSGNEAERLELIAADEAVRAALAAGASPPLAGQDVLRGQVNAASDSLLAVAVAYENGHGIDADLLARTARAEGERLEAALAVSSAGAGEAQRMCDHRSGYVGDGNDPERKAWCSTCCAPHPGNPPATVRDPEPPSPEPRVTIEYRHLARLERAEAELSALRRVQAGDRPTPASAPTREQIEAMKGRYVSARSAYRSGWDGAIDAILALYAPAVSANKESE